jgi:phage/plasmid-like protein (TIGR03299 family)
MHNLTINNHNEVEMFCTGTQESAWHKLGQRSLECITWDEAMKLSHLNWNVEKKNFINPYTYQEIENMYGTFRTDNGGCLGMVGEKYSPIQNNRMGEVLDILVNNIGGSHYESAGSINGGRQVWALVNLKNTIAIGDDITENYLMFTNSHDGKSSAQVKLTNTRVVCQNTLNIALRDKTSFFKIGHYPNIETRISGVMDAIHNINNQINNLGEIFKHLNKKQISSIELDGLLNTILKAKENETTQIKNKKMEIYELFENNDNNAFPEQRGSMYNALNSITNFVDHRMSTRGEKELSRAENALFGAGEMLKFMALTELATMAGCKQLIS